MKAYIFVETGEKRAPKKGEWHLWLSGGLERAQVDWAADATRPILRMIEVELPTRAEVSASCPSEPMSDDTREALARGEWMDGVRWLAARLGIELEGK